MGHRQWFNRSSSVIILAIITIIIAGALWSCKTPTPTSPLPTPTLTPVSSTPTPTPTPVVVSPLPTGEVKPRAVVLPGSVVTGTIAIFWRDPVGPEPQEVISSGTITSELFIDLELRLENGEALTRTIVTGLSAFDAIGNTNLVAKFAYEWQDIPPGGHKEYARLRWELAASDTMMISELGGYEPYHETVYGVLVLNGERVPLDSRSFGLYRTVTVTQYYYYYLPLVLKNAGNP